MNRNAHSRGPRQKGATIILVAVSMVVLLGMAALAIDVGYFYVLRGELQNAADSGALAGAQVLYNSTGTEVNTGANQVAIDYVHDHYSEQSIVSVATGCSDQLGGTCAERGHWSFSTRTFTPSNSLAPADLWNKTTAQLDADTTFINAVRVVTTRTVGTDGQPAAPFFARIFGARGPVITASAVAYIGFAGTLKPTEADEPIAICKQALLDSNGEYTCNIGRMLTNNSDTAAWTNFSQPCATASGSSMAPLICATGNPNPIALGTGMGTTNGVQDTTLQSLETCWKSQAGIDTNGDGVPDQLWKLTLPVIDCPSSIGPCTPVVGAVEITVVWINRNTDPQMNDIPQTMFNPDTGTQWTCNPAVTGKQACWDSFVNTFHLVSDALGTPAPYQSKTLYFLPDCTPHIPAGITGGQNFGILAKIPVLVK